ncbi:MAG: helix-turn-helix transcriptional regulator [Candidatus Omnitrophica bacterium]|nr:helix-turn-helix transcriptional regulator [Candidatus Omnitrophota bacterium]MCG2814129.1 helix-turn-helix transcriptional regulator [Thermodesulfovibrionales bacterium]
MGNIKDKNKGMNIQQDLQTLMRRHNLSREDVASKLGVSAMTIYRWEHGKNLPKSRLVLREFEGLKQSLWRKTI